MSGSRGFALPIGGETSAGAQAKADAAQAAAIAASAQRGSNLSDLANAGTARTNLGLGGAATLAVGTTAGTVAAGDDTRLNLPQMAADRGYLAWTAPIYAMAGGTVIPTAGLLNLHRIRRVPAGSVTSIITYVTAVGVTLTAGQCFAALYTAAGALVAQTADQATPWVSTGLKTMTLAGGPYPITAGDYYIGTWFNGSTGPSLVRSGTVNFGLTNAGLSAPNFESASANASITTTAPPTLGTQTAAVYEWWFALA
jgi:hypothetical protein